jgi:hypothetical protein
VVTAENPSALTITCPIYASLYFYVDSTSGQSSTLSSDDQEKDITLASGQQGSVDFGEKIYSPIYMSDIGLSVIGGQGYSSYSVGTCHQ